MADSDRSIYTLRYNQTTSALEGFGGGTPQWTPLSAGGGGGISALTGDVTASGTGSVAATAVSIGGASAANVASAVSNVIASASNVLYVNQNQPGTYTPDGSILRPYLTIMAAVNKIIANNNALNYLISVAPGTYTESISLNSTALTRLAIIAENQSNGNMSNDAIPVTSLVGDITSTSNNANLKALIMRGFDVQGNINLTGDVTGTTFGQYGIIFSDMMLYSTGATAINLNNVGQVIIASCGTAIQSGAGAVTVLNTSFWGIYSTFLNFGAATITTNAGVNKPSGFSSSSVNASFGNFLDSVTIGAGSILTMRFSRATSAIGNSGTFTSVNCVFSGTVTNNGGATWNSNGDSYTTAPSNSGTLNRNGIYNGHAVLDQTLLSRVLSGASVGGAANEELTVAGLLTTSTIYAVTQSVPGANNVAMIGFTNDTNGSLKIIWTADPGAGAKVVVTFI